MSRVFAVILAGGYGSRLGNVRKAELRIGGRRVIDRVADALIGVEREIIVATGQDIICPLPPPTLALRDAADIANGPLAGLQAACAHLFKRASADDMLVSVATDTPFLPRNYVPRLLTAAQRSGAAFAAWGENFYPTNSAWRIEILRRALSDLDDSSGPRAALARANAIRVDWTAESALDPFANANTLAELVVLQRRATSR